jgi:hypothetical protein
MKPAQAAATYPSAHQYRPRQPQQSPYYYCNVNLVIDG